LADFSRPTLMTGPKRRNPLDPSPHMPRFTPAQGSIDAECGNSVTPAGRQIAQLRGAIKPA
jgi:hypothetical protein